MLAQNLKIDNIKLVMDRINALNKSNPDKSDEEYSENIIAAAIIDSFKMNANSLKRFSDFCVKKGLQIGRRHKKVLLKYLNYRRESDKEELFRELKEDNAVLPKDELEIKLAEIEPVSCKAAFDCFNKLWEKAVREDDKAKLRDYLFGLYSKIHAYLNLSEMSNIELFAYNKPFIKDDLGVEAIEELKKFCENSTAPFYDKYVSLLKKELQKASLEGKLETAMIQEDYDIEMAKQSRILDRGGDLHYLLTEEYDAIYLKLNQAVYNHFYNYDRFLNYVLDALQQSYRLLVNNKALLIEIDNIYIGNRNIKWLLYAYIGVYSERFIKVKEHRKFFSPEKICNEMFKAYGYKILDSSENDVLALLKRYYRSKEDVIDKIYELLITDNSLEELKQFLEEWAYVYYGFTFNDCYIIECRDDVHAQFSKDIQNDNKILFVFYKYRMDERKIPCPVCKGLNVSGNSYPEVGHRSWECKNVICPSRSKSDRGKRYSFKTNYMQFGAQNPKLKNIIDKELLSKWRKDITGIVSDEDIYYMFIKYFSFVGEKLLFINVNLAEATPLNEMEREIVCITLLKEECLYHSLRDRIKINQSLFHSYFIEGTYINRFIQLKKYKEIAAKYNIENNKEISYVINGDAFDVLAGLPKGCASAAVTSPPYFNAREYSQWKNMYLYYIDMFNIVRNALMVLDDGGIFVYNIGDINGNEMTVAKSNMGIKRMLLGAYSILIFEKAGYELVENYIWNKGEPQSKRNTNDGNFTPHYQKPVNCYEHIFVFKRKDDLLKINFDLPDKWKTYITNFVPVYKINCYGENILGHTAPYPEDIPDLAISLCGRRDKYLLDPFLGSGTTVIAANKNGCCGIGIEFSKEYAELSKDRIKKECPGKVIQLF